MLRLPAFRYLAPSRLEDACRLLADHGPLALPVAGGTDLYPNMKRRQFEPSVLVGLRGIRDLGFLAGDERSGLRIGAGMTLTQVSTHPAVARAYPALAKAAGSVSTPPLRNMGTIGGNLCVDTRCNYYNMPYPWRKAVGFCMKKDGDICLVAPGSHRCLAISSSDVAPVMIALDARVRLVSARGERVIPAQALYQNDGIAYLTRAPDEILTEILVPPADGLRATYWKLRRRGSFDFPILGVAVALRVGTGGAVEHARIVLGAVASRPVVAEEAVRALIGRRLTPEIIGAAAQAASRPAKPLDNADLDYFWRKRMVRVYVERALRELAGLPAEGGASR